MTDYNKQATDFLKVTETTLKSEFLKNDFYFPDDVKERDIYEITLTNPKHRYRFMFGQSIANSGLKTKYINRGTGIERAIQEREAPTAYDVLTCLTKYHVGTFDNFCSDFCYNTDSRIAYKTYKAVLKEWKNIEKMFTADQLELLREIQ